MADNKKIDYNKLPDISELDYGALPDIDDVKKKDELGAEVSPSLEEPITSGANKGLVSTPDQEFISQQEFESRTGFEPKVGEDLRYQKPYEQPMTEKTDYMGVFNKKEDYKIADESGVSTSFFEEVKKSASEAEYPTEYLIDVANLKKRVESLPQYFPETAQIAEPLKQALAKVNPQNIEQLRQEIEQIEGRFYSTPNTFGQFQSSGSGSPLWGEYENKVIKDPITTAAKMLAEDSDKLRKVATGKSEYVAKGEEVLRGVGIGLKEYVEGYTNLLNDLKGNKAVNDVLKKLESKEELSTEERLLLKVIVDNAKLHGELDKNIPTSYKIGEAIGTSIGFMGEFIVTGGATAGVGKAMLKQAVKMGVKGTGKKLALNAAIKLAQTGVQTPLMPSLYQKTAIDVSKGEDFWVALGNNVWQTAAEVGSERVFLANPVSGAGGAANEFLRRAGINFAADKGAVGVLRNMGEEYLEEKVGEIMTAPKDYDSFKEFWKGFTDKEQNLITFGSTALLTGGMGSVGLAGDAISKAKHQARVAKLEKFLPSDLRAEIDVIMGNKDLTVQQQYGLVADLISERIDMGELEENPSETAANAIAYLNHKTQVNAAESTDKSVVIENGVPTIGKVEPVGNMDEQLAYLKEQGVEVPDGTTAEQLTKLYEQEKKKEPEPTEDKPSRVVEFTGEDLAVEPRVEKEVVSETTIPTEEDISKKKNEYETLVSELESAKDKPQSVIDEIWLRASNIRSELRKLEFIKKYKGVPLKVEEESPITEELDKLNSGILDGSRKRYKKGKKVSEDKDLGGIYETEGNAVLYRGVSEEDWKRIQKQGFIDTDMRSAISEKEGMNLGHYAATALTYIPEGKGVVLAIDVSDKSGLFMIGADDYVRSSKPIPLSDVVAVSSVVGKSDMGQTYLPIENGKVTKAEVINLKEKKDESNGDGNVATTEKAVQERTELLGEKPEVETTEVKQGSETGKAEDEVAEVNRKSLDKAIKKSKYKVTVSETADVSMTELEKGKTSVGQSVDKLMQAIGTSNPQTGITINPKVALAYLNKLKEKYPNLDTEKTLDFIYEEVIKHESQHIDDAYGEFASTTKQKWAARDRKLTKESNDRVEAFVRAQETPLKPTQPPVKPLSPKSGVEVPTEKKVGENVEKEKSVEKTIEDRNKFLNLQHEKTKDEGTDIVGETRRTDDRGKGVKVGVPRKPRVVVGRSNRIVRGTPVKKYSVSNMVAAALEYILPKSSVDKLFVETKDAQLFHDRISKSKEGNKFSASVFVYPVEDYKKYRLFMTEDGNAGVAIDDKGTIISVFSFGTGQGRAAQMVVNAIMEGGTHLDHFNTGLTKYYYDFGFIPVARVKFNEEFAPDDWNYETYKKWNNGRPDVVLMAYMGGDPTTLHERLGKFGEYETALENAPYYDTFEEAQAAQAKIVEQLRAEGGVSTLEEKKITQVTGIKPKNLRDVYKAGRDIFGLNRVQALAQAIVVNKVVEKIAKKRGVSVDKVWDEIEFRKGLSEEADALYQAVWHGSPYEFDKFRLDKIGTGEGAQAFGWGLYFTDKKAIAEGYAKMHDFGDELFVNGQKYAGSLLRDVLVRYNLDTMFFRNNIKETKSKLNELLNALITNKIVFKQEIAEIKEVIDFLGESPSIERIKPPRNLYKVKLHGDRAIDDFNYLRWDKPLTKAQEDLLGLQSSENYRKLVEYRDSLVSKYGGQREMTKNKTKEESEKLIKLLATYENEGKIYKNGKEYYDELIQQLGSPKEASLFLLRAGIDGIKYPTESTYKGSHEESFNYVIFDENVAEIEDHIKFQKQKTAGTARGAIQFLEDGRAIISAMTNPNVSTPLHEIAHLYEKYMTTEERKAVLKWAKHKEWSVETSEKFARGFEKYLATGKAPLPSLEGVFRRFKAWLTDIYNGITGSEIDIELNDAMTDIYSAMLGKDVVQKTKKKSVEKVTTIEDWQNSIDTLFQIVGEKGAAELDKAEEATVRMDNLNVAREMETDKKDAKTIKLATGWERGADGKWRYEVLDGKLSNYWDKADILEEAWTDPELFKAYPELKNIVIGSMVTDWETNEGSYVKDGVDGKPTIYAAGTNRKNLQSVMLHEIQHAIQEIEGFARGGNAEYILKQKRPKTREDIYREEKQKLIDKQKKYLDEFRAVRDNYFNELDKINKLTISDVEKEKLISKAWVDTDGSKLYMEIQRQLEKLKMPSLSDYGSTVPYTRESFNDAFAEYERLSGEVESRNVQTRINYTHEQRRQTLLEETEDVSRKDQIFIYDNLGGVSNILYQDTKSIEQQKIDSIRRGAEIYKQSNPKATNQEVVAFVLKTFKDKGKTVDDVILRQGLKDYGYSQEQKTEVGDIRELARKNPTLLLKMLDNLGITKRKC